VRSLNARVAEFRKQLEKLGGTQPNGANGAAPSTGQPADPPAAQASGLPYPTIRSLPLLGAKYADYYRRAKIEETVYELLTEQYELAKVQEAKETPSVKILDPASVPEKKSFPPRLAIMFVGTFFVFGFSLVWVLGSTRWKEVDPRDPRKIFMKEIVGTLRAQAPWASQNGNSAGSRMQKMWERLGRRPPASGPLDR
jgi:hypothetical protein